MHMSVAEEVIRKETGIINSPLRCLGCTNSLRYHADKFHMYRNYPNNMEAYAESGYEYPG